MVSYRKIIVAIFLLSFVVFVALFGSLPAFRKTPIGYMNRLIWIKIPGLLLSADRLISGGRCALFLKKSGHYLMNENHPLVLIFYMAVVIIAEILFVPAAWPRLSSSHRLAAVVTIAIPFITTFKSVSSTSSVITKDNLHSQLRHYPYDHVLFHPGKMCRTCQMVKPARSKHCRICKVCVAKQDHHCIWVMNCLGRGNYVYFIGMILSLAVLLSYGAYLCYLLLDDTLQDVLIRRSAGIETRSHWTVGRTYVQRFDLWTWAFTEDVRIGSVGLLALFTAPLAWGLFLYHVYLIWAGTTTNESFKWEEWKEDVADGFVYKDGLAPPFRNKSDDADTDPEIFWPVSSSQRLINKVSQQPWRKEDDIDMQRTGWVRVQSLKEVDNIYDLGFVDNLRDIFRTS
ncbi:palmitoyltransferase swf1 [Xylographa bjoerkii]|nr:palmitoyltransferase swf1 [Xylographa bjoerkii]